MNPYCIPEIECTLPPVIHPSHVQMSALRIHQALLLSFDECSHRTCCMILRILRSSDAQDSRHNLVQCSRTRTCHCFLLDQGDKLLHSCILFCNSSCTCCQLLSH